MEELNLVSRDGTKLFARKVTPKGDVEGRVLVIHGYGDHSGRYVELLEALANAGLEAVCCDMRGHGKSAGLRAMIHAFEEYLDDNRAAYRALTGDKPAPVVVYGHSMGGLITTHLLAAEPALAKAVIIGSPLYGRALKVPAIKIALGRGLGKLIPTLALATGITAEHITHDPGEIAIYNRDTLLNKKARAGWFLATEEAMAQAPEKITRIKVPMLMMHGEMDEVASFQMSKELFGRAGSAQKKFLPLPGMRHEPIHEIERARVIKDIVDFAAAHA